jgi:Phytanoyl-CoA dioxygenase (PhyH)
VELSRAQKETFYREGFLQLPGAVPRELVAAARRAINASLGDHGIDPAQLTRFRARSYCPELQGASVITNLVHTSSVWSCAESAIGPGQIKSLTRGQIALRFPSTEPLRLPHPHIDGMYTPSNGVPKGEIRNFTALVGVVLSEIEQADMGNLTVWPGSHVQYEQYFRERGPQALLEGMPDVALAEPVQLTGEPGDAVLCHYQLGHGIAGNNSPNIRYAIYFRLKHVDHDAIHWECMTDIWREWAGMRDAVGAPVSQSSSAAISSLRIES